MNQNKTRFIFGLLTVIFLMFLLSKCKSNELRAIEYAASTLQITTGQELSRSIQDKGTALGKPFYPEILIVYEPINNHTTKDVYEEIVGILIKNNWVGSESNIGRDYFTATLQQSGFEMSTGVSIDEKKNVVTISIVIH